MSLIVFKDELVLQKNATPRIKLNFPRHDFSSTSSTSSSIVSIYDSTQNIAITQEFRKMEDIIQDIMGGASLNGIPSTNNNNNEMDIQAINQSRERSQAAQIQQLIDSGLVQSEKTKYPMNQGAGAVPSANNVNEKAAADVVSTN